MGTENFPYSNETLLLAITVQSIALTKVQSRRANAFGDCIMTTGWPFLQLQLKVNALVTAANERSRRRELLLGFSSSPADFINGLISSQARDLRAQKTGGNAVALRRTQFFDSRYLVQ